MAKESEGRAPDKIVGVKSAEGTGNVMETGFAT